MNQAGAELVDSEIANCSEKEKGNTKQERLARLRKIWGIRFSFLIIFPQLAYAAMVLLLTYLSTMYIEKTRAKFDEYGSFQRILVGFEREVVHVHGVLYLHMNHYQGYPLFTGINATSAEKFLDDDLRSIDRDFTRSVNSIRLLVNTIDNPVISSIFDIEKSYQLKYSSGLIQNSTMFESLKLISSALFEMKQMNFSRSAIESESADFIIENIANPIKEKVETAKNLIVKELVYRLHLMRNPVQIISWFVYVTNVVPLIMVLLWFYVYIPRQNSCLMHLFKFRRAHVEIAVQKCDYFLRKCLEINKRNYDSLLQLNGNEISDPLTSKRKEENDKGNIILKKYNKPGNLRRLTAINLIILVANVLICAILNLSNNSNSVFLESMMERWMSMWTALSMINQESWRVFIDIQNTFRLGVYQDTNFHNRDMTKEILTAFEVFVYDSEDIDRSYPLINIAFLKDLTYTANDTICTLHPQGKILKPFCDQTLNTSMSQVSEL
jgi:hypothetical protein